MPQIEFKSYYIQTSSTDTKQAGFSTGDRDWALGRAIAILACFIYGCNSNDNKCNCNSYTEKKSKELK